MTMQSETERSLPLAPAPASLVVAIVLVLLMACTRGQHVASVDALPSASWSVFFLAGALLRPRWMFAVLFVLAASLDYGSFAAGTISDWCLSPAYWVLLPAYGSLWLAGHLYARIHRDHPSTLPRLVVVLVAAAFVAYLISGGGYYAFSGHYEPTFAGFLPRIERYYPRALGTLTGYVGLAAGLLVIARGIAARWPARIRRAPA